MRISDWSSDVCSSDLRNDENLGVAAGNNQGIVAARQRGCEYVILLNNDIVIADDKLLHLIGNVINDRSIKVLVPKIYFYDTGLLWYAGGDIRLLAGTAYHDRKSARLNSSH